MSGNDTVLKFNAVSFEHSPIAPILHEVNFVLRRGAKMTLMGQNGAGKSTIFGLITGMYKPDSGSITVVPKVTIATAPQVIPRDKLECSVREFFQACFSETVYDIDPRIDAVLEVVNLHAPHDKKIGEFSGGQQARLLLASALIQDPDILLLDEPTNNLDKAGIAHLTEFLKKYRKTCLVISHDADFLNAFTHGVLYLDVHTHVVEQYDGNYHDVVKEISARIEKENRKNAQLQKTIQEKKDKANFFAHKGGQMRSVAKRMRDLAEDLEGEVVSVRKEDKTIRPFEIPVQKDIPSEVLTINSLQVIKNNKPKIKKVHMVLHRRKHLQLIGPNGIGKSTLLESLARIQHSGVDDSGASHKITSGVVIGYYRQDFSTLNFSETPFEALMNAMDEKDEKLMRSVAAGFLINRDMIHTKIGNLSEGQKGLVAFAQLVLLRPGLLILDEPTNHINFRHLPIIASALDKYEGAMIIVSHVPDFIAQVRIDQVLDLEK
ncbi:MAG: ATP-binding cassette domain-containing protein [Candidatus Paceibacterota bacterium]